MRIEGQLLEVQHQAGSFNSDRDGSQVNWENVLLRIFDGREVVQVKAKGEAISPARGLEALKGQRVAIDVDSPRQVETRSLSFVDTRQKSA
jgi:hypothetical protein